MAGHEAHHDGEGDIAPDSPPRDALRALPHPPREHGLDDDGHDKIQGEESPRRGLEQGEGEDADVVAILGEEQAVQHEEAEHGAAHHHAEGLDERRPREEEDDGDEAEHRDEGEGRHLAHEGEEGVDPGHGGAEGGVVPEIAKAHQGEQGHVDEGEPAHPAEQPASRGHLVRLTGGGSTRDMRADRARVPGIGQTKASN